MAREILVLERSPQRGEATLVFRYPIDQADRETYTDRDGATVTVVPTPSAGLPEAAQNLYTVAELAEFDAGEAMWKTFTLNIKGLTGPEAVAAARAVYAGKEAEWRAQYARRYSHIGTFIDAV